MEMETEMEMEDGRWKMEEEGQWMMDDGGMRIRWCFQKDLIIEMESADWSEERMNTD